MIATMATTIEEDGECDDIWRKDAKIGVTSPLLPYPSATVWRFGRVAHTAGVSDPGASCTVP